MYTPDVVEHLKLVAGIAFSELLASFEGIEESESWKRLPPVEGEYLHTDGSILSQVTHVAGCKVLYASAAFHKMEVRLRHVTDRIIAIGADWKAAKDYLTEAQQYWLSSWNELNENCLDQLVATNWGDQWPTWKIIHTVTAHDSYHAGQIAITRATAADPVGAPPPLSPEEIEFLRTFSAW
jgi:hypothetical protein